MLNIPKDIDKISDIEDPFVVIMPALRVNDCIRETVYIGSRTYIVTVEVRINAYVGEEIASVINEIGRVGVVYTAHRPGCTDI